MPGFIGREELSAQGFRSGASGGWPFASYVGASRANSGRKTAQRDESVETRSSSADRTIDRLPDGSVGCAAVGVIRKQSCKSDDCTGCNGASPRESDGKRGGRSSLANGFRGS